MEGNYVTVTVCISNYVDTTTSIVAIAQTMHRLQPEINIQQMACCI